MRLFKKVYRTFPELDRFTDEQCRGFERAARREQWTSGLFMNAIGLGLAAMWTAFGVWQFLIVLNVVSGASDPGWGQRRWIVLGAVAAVLFTLAGLCIARAIYAAWLRDAIAHLQRSTRCPSCSYPLLGLAVEDDKVVCPECGLRMSLAARGWTRSHLIATVAGERPVVQERAP